MERIEFIDINNTDRTTAKEIKDQMENLLSKELDKKQPDIDIILSLNKDLTTLEINLDEGSLKGKGI